MKKLIPLLIIVVMLLGCVGGRGVKNEAETQKPKAASALTVPSLC